MDMWYLRMNIMIEFMEEGYDFYFQVDGEEDVEMILELMFREGGELEGVDEVEDEVGNKVYYLK